MEYTPCIYSGVQNLSNNAKIKQITVEFQKRRSAFQTTGTAVRKVGGGRPRTTTAGDTSNSKERHHYGGPGVLVWGGIILNGRTELPDFDRGSVTGDRYCEEVLLPHVRLFRGAIVSDFIFMEDNARPHRTIAV
ncbi:transposable element Tcb2 transposase [Trichonephila clavipes]|nr:transposable element Tcb2 transposase [Trichonephila clavipes]